MTPLPDHLLRAVLDVPTLDAPRLIAADWWEENGAPDATARAEFVRTQCALVRLNTQGAPPAGPAAERWRERRDGLRVRERELLRFWATEWLPEIPGLARWRDDAPGPVQTSWPLYGWLSKRSGEPSRDAERINAFFRRGFVGELTCAAAEWLAHADVLLAKHPITAVRLTTWPEATYSGRGRAPDAEGKGKHQKPWQLFRGFGPNADGGRVVWAQLSCDRSNLIRHLLAAEWPGVAFALPGVG